MNRKTMAILIVVLAGLLVWATGSSGSGSLAQGGDKVGPQAVLPPLLQYQGRLTDPGTGEAVADGLYLMSFRLYNVESGGSPLWMETKDVSVQGGLFSTVLGDITLLEQDLFDGRALWLSVKVDADAEAMPRQQVLPVAYALGLVPGAVVEANSSFAVLQVNNTGSGDALSVGGDLNVSGSLTGGSHDHDDRYYIKTESDDRFLNAAGPDEISGSSGAPMLKVVQSGNGYGLWGEASGSDAAVLGYHTGSGYGVWGYSIDGYGGYFASNTGTPLYVSGAATISGDLLVGGKFEARRTRYVPITVGDLMYDENNDVYTGDCCNGILFPDGSQSGGSITFPLPDDYDYGTDFDLDLYLIPLDSGSGALDFFVRWVGLVNGGWSGTGPSTTSSAVSLGTPNYIHKQSFTLPGFSAGSPPELVELTVRRISADTYGGRVTLIGLRLSYQALR